MQEVEQQLGLSSARQAVMFCGQRVPQLTTIQALGLAPQDVVQVFVFPERS